MPELVDPGLLVGEGKCVGTRLVVRRGHLRMVPLRVPRQVAGNEAHQAAEQPAGQHDHHWGRVATKVCPSRPGTDSSAASTAGSKAGSTTATRVWTHVLPTGVPSRCVKLWLSRGYHVP